jgi:NADH:ubiquinone oxidoreductase subunit 4 (subunit M)
LVGCSIVFASFTAIRQIDIKRIVAYSSIAHMNLAVFGLFSNSYFGISGGLILSVSHGFISAGMFLLIGLLYDRYHSRLIFHYSGLFSIMPILSVFLILYSLSNIGFPLSYNFIGESSIIFGLIKNNLFFGFIGLIGILTSVIYSMWLVNRLLFGDLSISYIHKFYDINILEISCLYSLLIPIFIFGVYPDILEIMWYLDIHLLINKA